MSENSCEYEIANAACAAALFASEPMKPSISSPPMFIAMPCTPLGSPKRNSERMIDQSGAKPPCRGNDTTHPPRHSLYSAYSATTPDAIDVPIAAPFVPYDGMGPRPRMSTTFRAMLSSVVATPSTIGVRASPAERSAPPSM